MPAITVPIDAILRGPGYLYRCIPGTALPTFAVTGSKFTDAFPVAYVPVGATRSGTTFTGQTNVEAITVAEYLEAIAFDSTSRSFGVAFDMAQITLKSFALAFNGGTTTTVSGTGATTLSKWEPPDLGTETRTMLAWESQDSTVRIFWYQGINGGEVQFQAQKAPEFSSLPASFNIERPSAGTSPLSVYTAGTTRVGV